MDSLLKFIQPRYDAINYTHTISIKNQTLPAFIEPEKMTDFYQLVSQVQNKVSERFDVNCPVIIEVAKNGSVTAKEKVKLVSCLQFAVTNHYDLTSEVMNTAVVHEEEDKITIMMPYCQIPLEELRKEVRDSFIYLLDDKKVLTDDHKMIVNKTVYNKPFWLNRPTDQLEFYPIIDAQNFDSVTCCNFSQGIKNGMIDDSKFEDSQFGANIFLSLYGYQRVPLYRNTQTKDMRKAQSNSELIAERIKEKVKTDTEVLIELIKFLNKTRTMTLSGFLEVGQCIFNITDGDGSKGISLWKQTSQETYHDDIEKYWKTLRQTASSLGTFRYWCSQDDPEGYKAWQNTNLMQSLDICLNPTAGDTDIANVMYRMYQDRFLCASIKDQVWFEFKGHKYEQLDGGVALRILLSTEVAEKFEKLLNECNVREMKAPEGVEKEKWKVKQGKCIGIIRGLKISGTKTAIMKEASEKFYEGTFLDVMNKNKMIFVCENGVIDLERALMNPNPDTWIRPGSPDDKVTISCGNHYKSFAWDDKDVLECIKYFEQVYCDEPIRNYNKRVIASCFEGGNKEKIVPVWTGVGNNSKSVLEMLCEKIFGEYCAKPPSVLITAKERTSPGSATPEYEVLRYARICFFQEPKAGTKLNDSTLKELSSGFDTIYSRALNQMPKKITPQFTPIIVCNKIPGSDGSDVAVMNRLRIIEHNSRFSKDAPKDEKEQREMKVFPIDLNFENKVQGMIQPMLWMLLQEYAKYVKEGLPTPNEVTIATNAYKKNNDMFGQFLDDKFEKVEDKDAIRLTFIKLDAAYQTFRQWIAEEYPNTKIQPKNEFRQEMESHGHKTDNLRYYGLKPRQQG